MSIQVHALILFMSLLAPLTSFCGSQEQEALEKYFSILAYRDVTDLDSLLAPDFEYHFVNGDKLVKLSRNDELKSLARLSQNDFQWPDSIDRDKLNSDTFHVKVIIRFDGMDGRSPRTPPDAMFRGSPYEIDEALTVTLKAGKISRIVEARAKGRGKLSFGFLKLLHTGGAAWSIEGVKNELHDKTSHNLLMTRRTDPDSTAEIYYWPNKRLVEGFQYPALALLSNEQAEAAAIKAYLMALRKEDIDQLATLLSPTFKYRYYRNKRQMILSREDVLNGLKHLFKKEFNLNSIGTPDLLVQDKEVLNKFHVKLFVFFDAMPKMVAGCSFFCEGDLQIDEVMLVKLNHNRIDEITELEGRRGGDKLSFGQLMALHLHNFETSSIESKTGDWIFQLYDKDTRELLMSMTHEPGFSTPVYFWPNNRRIGNFQRYEN